MAEPAAHRRVLVERLKRGDALAVAELAATYGDRIARIAIRYVKNREDAEEVAQDVLLKVSRAIGTFRGDAALGSWIFRITSNAAVSHLRQHQASRRAEVPFAAPRAGAMPSRRRCESSTDAADRSSMPDQAYLRGQMRKRLRDALLALPLIYRTSVELRDVEGLSTAEASCVLGVTTQTIKSRLHRGRALLRPRLAEFRAGLPPHPRATGVPGRRSALAASEGDPS